MFKNKEEAGVTGTRIMGWRGQKKSLRMEVGKCRPHRASVAIVRI